MLHTLWLYAVNVISSAQPPMHMHMVKKVYIWSLVSLFSQKIEKFSKYHKKDRPTWSMKKCFVRWPIFQKISNLTLLGMNVYITLHHETKQVFGHFCDFLSLKGMTWTFLFEFYLSLSQIQVLIPLTIVCEKILSLASLGMCYIHFDCMQFIM